VIGEDLGTVSDDLRARLAHAEVLSYRLLLFEREAAASSRRARIRARAGRVVHARPADLRRLVAGRGPARARRRWVARRDRCAPRRRSAAGARGLSDARARGAVEPGTPRGEPDPALADAMQAFLARTPPR
jgi:hypothetical protein